MTLRAITGVEPKELRDILKEIQGRKVDVVAGAAAGTAMTLAGIRLEDTIQCAFTMTTAGGAPADDTANITIQDTHASGTITLANAVPADGDTVTVNGDVYTFRTTPTSNLEVKIAGTINASATNLAAVINAYQTRRVSPGLNRTPQVTAVAVAAVVTVTSVADGAGNAPVVSNSAHAVVANSGTASVTVSPVSVVDGDTVTVNGVVFTAKAAPSLTDPLQVQVGASDIIMGANFANAFNHYNNFHGGVGAGIVAAANAGTGVVTITPQGSNTGNIITLAKTFATGANGAVSGATLAGGTATGSIKSATNLTGKSLIVHWQDKNY